MDKLKAYVALLGGILTVAIPTVIDFAVYLPPQWQAVVGAVVALLTALGVYAAPNRPKGAVIAPATAVESRPVDEPTVKPRHPWK